MKKLEIDTDYLTKTLHDLLSIPSPSGYTDTVVHYVSEALEKMGLTVELTRRGAIRAIRPGEHRHEGARAIVSHVDTLGAQVKSLKPNGRVELVPIGHWSSRFAEGARASVFTELGAYTGTILPLKASGHTFNREIDSQPVTWQQVEMRIDALSRNIDELHALGIEVGDIVAIDPQPEFLDNGYIVSRHLDDKAGVAAMMASLKAMQENRIYTPVDTHWLFTIAEEIGVGASTVVTSEIASMLAIDNGTTAQGQNSSEFGVTIAMADQQGPFDYHLTKKLVDLCRENDIQYQKDVFRFYRSDAASALEAGHDVRTALATFGIDASHGYERIHVHALRSIAELIAAYANSPVKIRRDFRETAEPTGFTEQPVDEAEDQVLKPDLEQVEEIT